MILGKIKRFYHRMVAVPSSWPRNAQLVDVKSPLTPAKSSVVFAVILAQEWYRFTVAFHRNHPQIYLGFWILCAVN